MQCNKKTRKMLAEMTSELFTFMMTNVLSLCLFANERENYIVKL